ncbi:MAG: hypothetical protein U0791_13775 [Gemmataceae bacterium]
MLLWAAYFHPLLLQPNGTLYTDYSDLASEHLPGRIFLVREWRNSGELPLWNPYQFCGSPFVHDIQAGTFYPPYAVTFLFPESSAGAVLSWVIALHVLAASVFAYGYARRHGLGETGGLVAGVGFAYSAKWLTHLVLAGHTITIGLAWLPLVLLGLESRRFAGKLGGAVAFAMLILGTHPQWTFYAGLFAAAWTLPRERTRANLLQWAIGGAGLVLVATLLAAVQLLPTWEASRWSTRTSGLQSTQSLTAGLFSLLSMFGPTAEYNPPVSWELRSLLSLFGLAAALIAPRLAPDCRWGRTVLLAMLAFSFGGAVLIEWLPGFNLFRSASRMLVIAAFPVAYLAAVATNALLRSEWAERRKLGFVTLIVAGIGGLPSIAVALSIQNRDLRMWPEFGVYWVAALAGIASVGAAAFAPSLTAHVRSALWLAALLLELFAATIRLPAVKTQSEIYPDSPLVEFLGANADPASARVMDIELGSLPTDRVAPLGIGSPVALTHRLAMPRGYNPLDVRHYREYLNFTMGSDEPLLSLAATSHPIVPNFPRRVPKLWEQLNVRYLICFDDYLTNPNYLQDPAHAVKTTDWRFTTQFKPTAPVPALPPVKPDPLPRSLVLENLHHAMHPRAFVVPHSEPMPAGRELAALAGTDLHTTVLLAGADSPSRGAGGFRPAAIREYSPNRVAVDLGGGTGGWLVLNDVWYPGWTCQVDRVDSSVERANHTFRAVRIPDGAKEAVFRFEPASYRIGWWISAVTSGAVMLAGLLLAARAGVQQWRKTV